MLVLAGCVGQVPPSAADTALAPTQMTLQKNCREFTVQVTIEGQPRQAVGQACRSLMELAGHVGYVWLAQQI